MFQGRLCWHFNRSISTKRCGHTPGKDVVNREEAFDRGEHSDMRNEGYDILIMARTDANHTHGLVKHIKITKILRTWSRHMFIEAKNKEEVRTICKEVPVIKLLTLLKVALPIYLKELSKLVINLLCTLQL